MSTDGGMENPNLTFVTPTLIVGDRSLTDTVMHEVGLLPFLSLLIYFRFLIGTFDDHEDCGMDFCSNHGFSWFGNLVTNANWSDFWLNEGFTMYAQVCLAVIMLTALIQV